MRIFNPRPVLIHNMGKVACVAWGFCRALYGAEKRQKCTQSARTSGEANLLEASLLSPILACFARPTKTAMLPQATGKVSLLRPPIWSPESSASKHWIKMHWWQCKTENVSALWRINCLWHMHWIEILCSYVVFDHRRIDAWKRNDHSTKDWICQVWPVILS